ncbi:MULTISPECIES: hypothetical protein [unclassified Pseudomonas]|uniref:hypothetical protein n=1 Tax=unclassified Pseudomonas TaxID=196821 RepID=UPI000A1E26E2|nr:MULTISPECIES: hypothetical protein [unclassified Pseudomonas]
MHAFNHQLTATQEMKLQALDRWHRALDNQALRMDCPNDYHDELLRQCDEMHRRQIVSWEEWRDLRIEADQAYLRAIAGDDYR